jgi:phospholipase C
VGIIIAAAVKPTVIQSAAGATNSASTTTTPIKHLIVIIQENISFDHYFANILMLKNLLMSLLFLHYQILPP